MNRVFVRFLLWFFIAALPLQGFAAALKPCCGPTSGALMAGQPAPGAHAAMGQHCDDMAAAAETVSRHQQAGAHDSDQDHARHGGSATCSACAACSIGAVALPVMMAVAQPVFLSSKVVLAPEPRMRGYIPGGLERPPRSLS